ncbi:phage tail protein [Liquorilactobacillus hordei]|uniref:phage tail protein n=1 Tax=Liquorilactobacillus hordei TaxID=468911 RepID=UPI0039EBE83B
MAIVGLKTTYVFLVDPDTHKLISGTDKGLSESGVLQIGKKFWGSSQANITNLEGSMQPVNGDNEVQEYYQNPSSPSVAWTVNNLDLDTQNKLLGYVKDGLGYVKADVKPHLGLVVVSETLDRANRIYYAFPEGVLSRTSQNIGTDTDTAQTREADQTTYNAMDSDLIGGKNFKLYSSAVNSFTEDAMFAEIADGYTDPNTVSVTGVSLTKTTLSGKAGDSGSLVATVVPANATNKAISFTSSDSTVATIDSDGNYNLVKAGTATFTVTTNDGNKTATCAVTVSAA